MSGSDAYSYLREKRAFKSYINFFKNCNPSFTEEIAAYGRDLVANTDLRSSDSIVRGMEKLAGFIFYLNINYFPKPEGQRLKTYQIIRDYNGAIKVTTMTSAPRKGIKRDRASFNSYDRKLYNSISRARQSVYELSICNDWKFYATFTINKECYDRYDLEAYISAFTKWLSNYSARKTDGKKIHYILVPELHKDGAWHLHGLLNGIPRKHLSFFEEGKHPQHLIDNGYLNWAAYEKKFGFCSLSRIRDKEKVTGYITKFIRKPACVQEHMKKHSKLYYCTKGLKRSTEIGRGFNLLDIDSLDFENEWVGIKWL